MHQIHPVRKAEKQLPICPSNHSPIQQWLIHLIFHPFIH
jgi:hypothetical protein